MKVFPKDDLPAIFGLPENTDRAFEQRTASEIIEKLKSNGFAYYENLFFNE